MKVSDMVAALQVRVSRISRTHVRGLIIVLILTYAFGAYVRGLFNQHPAPALHGAGLAVVILNIVTVGALAYGIWLLRPARIASWRRTGIGVLLGAIVCALALYAVIPHGGSSFVFAMIALWILMNNLPLPWGIATAVATMAGVAGVEVAVDGQVVDAGLMVAFIGVALGATANLQRKAAQQETAVAEANSVILAERSHLAREIHDILAHSLSAQIVHLEGARMLLSRDGDRVQALDRVERAQQLARAGLEETRRALATLRGESPPPDEALAELAEEFHVLTGRQCEVEVTGTPRELTPAAGLAVIRTGQEALTNVRKHAPGAQVHVRLAYEDDHVELDVTDTGGTEPALEDMGSGYGLVGMRERAELIGGTLETGPDGKGFRVSLRVPA
ncbi:sensor histidine kinase [Actinomadura barringtoniae]|uniref:histidine kinase n=1 Tax=Actinomadura barringtoniae TaxID=1427535 RepID=A0A939T9U9_9ACTN|nr:sensor histidine kinase [Actinomadura barringtoniae]MBO2451777.1 sensor histidine kinase [Actinomadura barringtoniae]